MTTTFKTGDKIIGLGTIPGTERSIEGVSGTIRSAVGNGSWGVDFDMPNGRSWRVKDENLTLDVANPFKVGDVVTWDLSRVPHMRDSRPETVKSLGNCDGDQKDTCVRFAGGGWDYVKNLKLVPPAPEPVKAPVKGHIVCLLNELGFPLPSKKPVVHGDRTAAENEADRLSKVHVGQTFAVFTTTYRVKSVEERVTTPKLVTHANRV